ncbi:DUF2066 domain-containing protein [Spiribacter sp. C176]|uniref:DUF2066 domain-containing protein n=2 Tax=Spiribacter salilacus TaxID=2664894 RepID=A0A6N7QRQ4_9GAMM|nr:DUF2066 domain-containing protein [Spiribacter salilacus]
MHSWYLKAMNRVMDFARRGIWIVLLIGISWGSATLAEVKIQQDRVEVAVADTSDAERQSATQTAIGAVLMHLTGLQGMAESPLAEVIAADAERYVLNFSYLTEDDDESLWLALRLDRPALRRALVERGMRVWPERRPLVLVWLAEQQGARRELIAAEQTPAWFEALQKQSDALGMRLIFPLLDLEDRNAMSAADVVLGFHDPIREASDRYGAERILLGVIQADEDPQQAAIRWTLLDETMVIQRWQDRGADALITLNRLMRDDFVYRPDLEAHQRLEIAITNVTSLADYQRAVSRLSDVDGVAQIQPMEVAGEQARFSLALSLDPARVRETLERDPQLTAEGDDYRLR